MELVDRQAVKDQFRELDGTLMTGQKKVTVWSVRERIDSVPSINAQPVVHAIWLDIIEHGWEKVICSNCKKYAPKDPLGWNIVKSRFCPNCGSVMNGGDADD